MKNKVLGVRGSDPDLQELDRQNCSTVLACEPSEMKTRIRDTHHCVKDARTFDLLQCMHCTRPFSLIRVVVSKLNLKA